MLSVRCLSVCPVLSVLSVTFVHCGETAGRIKMKLGKLVGIGPGHNVLDGNPAPHPQRGTSLIQFSAHICCGQLAAWIKMPLGMQIGLSPGDFVLDGDPALPSQKGGRAPSPIFGPFLLWPNGCMHQDATLYGCRPQPRGLCVRWGPSPPKFSAHVYYSYCDFIRTLHRRKALLVCSSSCLVFYAFYF